VPGDPLFFNGDEAFWVCGPCGPAVAREMGIERVFA
jgi:hypothetical protein